jgi:Xaa-Pro aminopeptidase
VVYHSSGLTLKVDVGAYVHYHTIDSARFAALEQGIQFTEPPSIPPDDHPVLEAGMVISTEPEVARDMLWEDVHVITTTGSEQRTSETVELREY